MEEQKPEACAVTPLRWQSSTSIPKDRWILSWFTPTWIESIRWQRGAWIDRLGRISMGIPIAWAECPTVEEIDALDVVSPEAANATT